MNPLWNGLKSPLWNSTRQGVWFPLGGSPQAGGGIDYGASIAAKIGNGDAWTFDDEFADPVGVVNATTLTRSNVVFVPGEWVDGSYFPLNGSASISADLSGVAEFGSASASVALWIKTAGSAPFGSGLGAGADPLSVYTGGNTAIRLMQSYVEGGGGGDLFYVAASCTTFEGNTDTAADVQVAGGTWMHLALVRNADGFKFYVNGALAETVPIFSGDTYVGDTGDYFATTTGMAHIPTERYCLPACDEILVAHGELSADEIAWLYNGGTGRSMDIFAP